MKLPVPFIQLPLQFDASVLAAEIDAIEEAEWKPHPQGFPGNSMLPLMAVDGNPDDESFTGPMRPTAHLRRCPYLTQVFASLGATIGRSRLMRLAGQAEVSRHADQGYYWAERVRVHVPIVTQPTVRFECGGVTINMANGECWIFDTWRQHCVLNDAEASRIHLVIDTVGGAQFWDLVGHGRAHGVPAPPGAWAPRRIAPREGQVVEFPCETVNVPVVMNPWELNTHLSLLLGDALPHPNLETVRAATQRFVRLWQGLWFQYGDQPAGHEPFRRALAAYLAEVHLPAQPIKLRNDLGWYSVLMTMIAKVAVVQPANAEPAGRARHVAMGDNA